MLKGEEFEKDTGKKRMNGPGFTRGILGFIRRNILLVAYCDAAFKKEILPQSC